MPDAVLLIRGEGDERDILPLFWLHVYSVTVSCACARGLFCVNQAQNVLDVTDSDVFILGAHFPQKMGRDPTHMVVIGRARVRG